MMLHLKIGCIYKLCLNARLFQVHRWQQHSRAVALTLMLSEVYMLLVLIVMRCSRFFER